MNIVVLGSNSFTGHTLCQELQHEFELIRVNRSGATADAVFDAIHDDLAILSNCLAKADVVINCISNGDVDSCENDPATGHLVNYEFVARLCDAQLKYGFHLLHFSTNAVYDGENPLYSESSLAAPLNRYGKIKFEADRHIQATLENYTILRPITMFGINLPGQRHNPFSFFYQQLANNEEIVAVDDVYVNMLYVMDLVSCCRKVIKGNIKGVFNISGDDIVNRFEFVSLIKEKMPESRAQITRVSSNQFATIAPRPADTSFDNSLMKAELGVYPEQLSKTIENLVAQSRILLEKAA